MESDHARNIALLLLKGGKSPMGKMKKEEDSEEESEDYKPELAGDVYDAFQAKDKEAFAEALHAYVMHCMGDDE